MNKKNVKPNLLTIKLLIVSVILATLTGCGSNTASEETEVNVAKATSKIAFSWWGNDPRHLYTMEGVDLFMQQNQDINVEYKYGIWNGYETRNKVFMNSHTEPDVMQINFGWLSQYSPDGTGYYDLYQLKDYIDLSGYTEADLSFGEMNGKLNALPIAYNSTVIYYNEDLYKKYGLPVPETWEDLFTCAEVMREDGIYQLGAVKKHVFLLLIAYYEQTMGKTVFAEDGTCQLTQEDMVYILNFYKKLIDEQVLMPIDQFDRNMLSTGELAGSVFWISDISNYCSSIEAIGTPKLGNYLTTDSSEGLTGWYKKPATMYAISASTDNPEESARLLDFLVNNREMAILQGTEKGIPVSTKALMAVEEEGLLEGYSVDANNQMIAAGEALKVMLPVMEDEDLIEVFKAGADRYIYDKETVEDAALGIIDEIKNILDK